MFPEAWEQEKGCAEQENHHGCRCLILAVGEAPVNNDLVQSFELPCESFVLRFQLLYAFVKLAIFFSASPDPILHAIQVLLLSLPRVLSRHFVPDFPSDSLEIPLFFSAQRVMCG